MPTPHARSQPSQNQKDRSYRRILLWAVGLNVLNDLWLHTRGRGPNLEPKTPIIQKSSRKALQRCAVHILPAAVSLFLVILHLKHYYMGKELNGVPNSTSLYLACFKSQPRPRNSLSWPALRQSSCINYAQTYSAGLVYLLVRSEQPRSSAK
jgi:hypothetical protein